MELISCVCRRRIPASLNSSLDAYVTRNTNPSDLRADGRQISCLLSFASRDLDMLTWNARRVPQGRLGLAACTSPRRVRRCTTGASGFAASKVEVLKRITANWPQEMSIGFRARVVIGTIGSTEEVAGCKLTRTFDLSISRTCAASNTRFERSRVAPSVSQGGDG